MPLKFIAKDDGGLEIEIYDVIGLWGLTVGDFSAKLKALKGKDVTMRINSPGGSVTEGLAIYNIIRGYEGNVVAYVDGVAASMASVITMAAKKIVMPENSFLMIHDPSVALSGTSEELRQVADVLDKMAGMLITAYTRGGKVDRAAIEKMITGESSSNEHWLTAAECLELGLCDEVETAVEAAAVSRYDSYFAARAASIPPVASTGGQQKQPMEKIIALFASLPATASEDEVASTVQTQLTRVASLENEKSLLVTAHATAIKDCKANALQEATNAVTTAETKRKAAIAALTNKYDHEGDLAAVTVTALTGDTTPEAFKDIILDVVAKRATKGAIRPAGQKEGDEDGGDDKVAQFVKQYKACDSDKARRILVRSNRLLAKQAHRQLQAADAGE